MFLGVVYPIKTLNTILHTADRKSNITQSVAQAKRRNKEMRTKKKKKDTSNVGPVKFSITKREKEMLKRKMENMRK